MPGASRYSTIDTSNENAWTIDEAAAFLGIKTKTLYKWAAEGKVPSYRYSGRGLRFSRSILDEWRKQQQHGGQ